MKTFEERYTAWIDGQLEGIALTAFEQELARRAEAGDAEAAETDRAAALQVRSLLKEHLRAPALTNTEFFSHQMRERIDAEADRAAARREANARPVFRFPTLAWPFARLAGAGVVCLFVAGALYYGTVPSARQTGSTSARVTPLQSPGEQVVQNGAPAQPPQAADAGRAPDSLFVKRGPTPAPLAIGDNAPAVTLKPDGNTPASTLHIDNANAPWVNNVPTLPDASGAAPSPTPVPSATPALMPAAPGVAP